MATSITHKNTGVKDKEVRPDQLAYGEFAINWHESGPFVQVKDADNTIIRVGGVIIQDEQPALGQKGAFWLSLAKDTLFIYTGDHWHPIGGGGDGGGEAPLPPVVNDGKLTIQLEDGTVLGTFTANQAGDGTVTIPASPEPAPPTWEGIEGKPDCFEPCEHEHPATPWPDIPEKPDCFPPCDHKHDFGDIENVPPPPVVNDGKLTIKDSEDNVLGEFTANQDGDTEVVIPSGLDCDGVADCLVKSPIDEPKYAFAALVYLNGFVYTEKPPHPPEDHASRPYLYFEVCDPDDHHMLELGEEGHGYCAGNKTIFRIPGTYIHKHGFETSIVASPPVYVDDRDAIYGFHPDDILVRDLKVFKGDYEKGVTTTEELWTGGKLESDNTGKSVGSFKLQPEWSFDPGVEENFFRIEFTCHRGDTYMYVFIVPYCEPPIPGTTTHVNPEIPNITINPMEDN